MLDKTLDTLKDMTLYIIVVLIIIILAFIVHGKALTSVEARLTKQEQYMHEVQAELEKKGKIIDEMAGYIATLDIEEDICSKTENEHCDKMNFGECEDCIKEYFKNKVEE